MGFLAVMAGATATKFGPYTASTDWVLKCTSPNRYTVCTTDGRTTSCENGELKTSDEEYCGNPFCACKDLRYVSSTLMLTE